MSLDVAALLPKMLEGALPIVRKEVPAACIHVERELQKIAEQIEEILACTATGEYSEEEAELLLEMQRNAAESVLVANHGIQRLIAEHAINEALGAVASLVNGALGWRLI